MNDLKIPYATFVEVLHLIQSEIAKEKSIREATKCIIEWNGWLDLTEPLLKGIKLILNPKLWDEMSYFLWEKPATGAVITLKHCSYALDTENQFLNYMKQERKDLFTDLD